MDKINKEDKRVSLQKRIFAHVLNFYELYPEDWDNDQFFFRFLAGTIISYLSLNNLSEKFLGELELMIYHQEDRLVKVQQKGKPYERLLW